MEQPFEILENEKMLAQKTIEVVEFCCVVGVSAALFVVPFALILTSPFWVGW